jgi:hypothetical protein
MQPHSTEQEAKRRRLLNLSKVNSGTPVGGMLSVPMLASVASFYAMNIAPQVRSSPAQRQRMNWEVRKGSLNDAEFHQRYRMGKVSFGKLVEKLEVHWAKDRSRIAEERAALLPALLAEQ